MKKSNESRLTSLRNIVAKDGGFTLIEVLAVMVIVGLLAAIAIPQIGKFRERAYVSSLKSDARMIINEAEGVYTDTQAYPVDEAALIAEIELSPSNSIVENSYEADENGITFEITNSKANKTLAVEDNKLGAVS